jgi:CRP-like cAMP-binding protein
MIVVEKVLFLSRVSIFTAIPSRELGHFALISEEVVIPKGKFVFNQGEPGDSMYLVVEGEFGVVRDGREIARMGPKDYFGEMSILDDEPRSASVVAKSDSLLLRIPRHEFLDIVANHPAAALAIIRTLSQRLRLSMEMPAGFQQPTMA